MHVQNFETICLFISVMLVNSLLQGQSHELNIVKVADIFIRWQIELP